MTPDRAAVSDLLRVGAPTMLCLSLSAVPTSIGSRFHNALAQLLGVDLVYKATTTRDLPSAIAGLRALGVRGCGVSMPYKTAALDHVDVVEDSAADLGALNTIVNDDGTLTALNTDVVAVQDLVAAATGGSLAGRQAVVVGSGGMARACAAALGRLGPDDLVVLARNPETGPAVAARFGARWVAEPSGLRPAVLVHATPSGMLGSGVPSPAPGAALVAGCEVVVECVAVPEDTPLVRSARDAGATVVTGAAVMATQAAEQFARYTGLRPSPEQVAWAQAVSRR